MGDHEAPPDTPLLTASATELRRAFPYSVLYSIPGGLLDGPPLGAPAVDAIFVYQVSSIGLRRDQADWMADTVRRTLLSRNPAGIWQVPLQAPDGWVISARLAEGNTAGVSVDGQPPYRIFRVDERFHIGITPA